MPCAATTRRRRYVINDTNLHNTGAPGSMDVYLAARSRHRRDSSAHGCPGTDERSKSPPTSSFCLWTPGDGRCMPSPALAYRYTTGTTMHVCTVGIFLTSFRRPTLYSRCRRQATPHRCGRAAGGSVPRHYYHTTARSTGPLPIPPPPPYHRRRRLLSPPRVWCMHASYRLYGSYCTGTVRVRQDR